jgi:hypothetical protein
MRRQSVGAVDGTLAAETGKSSRRFEAHMKKVGHLLRTAAIAAMIVTAGTATAMPVRDARPRSADSYEPSESARLQRAKDLISEEQWVAAIAELRSALTDPKEQSKDEALFWLAHSQNQVGDLAEAVVSVRRLQEEFKKSRWSAPAYSLLLELAQKLGRRDVLWRMAPPPPPPPPAATALTPPKSPARRVPKPAEPPATHATTPPPAPPPPPAGAPPPPPPKGFEGAEFEVPWVSESYLPDADLKIQALGRLIHTDAQKVIPMLGQIALERNNPGAARRAVFVLMQSRNPQAQHVVVDVAKKGPEPVRVAAVRELGRFGGPDASQELLQVYWTAEVPVKEQVVISLGQRSDAPALLKIAQVERNIALRETAVIALGRAGGYEQLRVMYVNAPLSTRRAIIRGLFTARDDDGLIRIADQEKEPGLRAYARERLRLMGTRQASAYLEKTK